MTKLADSVDQGTSSTRLILFDEVRATLTAPLRVHLRSRSRSVVYSATRQFFTHTCSQFFPARRAPPPFRVLLVPTLSPAGGRLRSRSLSTLGVVIWI